MPARRPRISQRQTQERMLAAAVDQINAAGLTVSLDHLSFEAVISAADVSRTAAYRRWPSKDLFLNDLVRELARAATPRAVVQDASWGLIAGLVLADAERLADPGERWALGVELMRQAADADFAVMLASAEWRTYLALNATFLSISDVALRAEVQVALAAAQQRFVEGIAAGWELLAGLLGFRLHAGVTSFDTLAAMISASVRGLVLMALADPAIASDRLEVDPFGGGTAPWSLAALGCASIAAGFLEPDPGVVWDEARDAALRSAMAAESLPRQLPEPWRLAGRPAPARMDGMPLDASNPLATASTLPYELPDYTRVRDEHYQPAIEEGMAEQLAQLADLAANPEPATIANVIEAWESSGQLFTRALNAFYTKQPADTNLVLDAADEAIAPQLAAHGDAIYLDRRLYDRLAALAVRVESGEVQLDPASAYWLERKLLAFERSGVNLPEDDQAKLRVMNHRIAELQSAFGREALAGMNGGAVLVTDAAELDGLSQAEIDAARERATETGQDGWLIELENTSAQRPLDVLTNRALRERIHVASVNRGLGGAHDTRALIVELTRLRAERATLLGFGNHASYVAADACAGTGKAVWDLLTRLAPAAVANARAEAVDLEVVWRRFEPEAPLAAWDWQFVSEQLRAERYALDASTLRPYLELERVLHEGVFAAANGLYGITFTEHPELKSYNPEGRVFEVAEADGTPIGLFVADFYTRPGKQGGAWMNNLVDQNHLLGQLPVVSNNSNLVKPPAGQPTLMTWDDVITLFHEFGHALHGLLSDTRYRSQSGTETPRDFVEYPSQVNEMWALDEGILSRYAVHHETGEPMPAEWVATLRGSTLFQQGFKTTEYLAAALLDQVWHSTPLEELPTDPDQVEEFEKAALAKVGLDFDLVPPRYRSAYFRHVFEGGYDAGYYSYIWSEVLDADTAAFITANGGLDRENGERFRRHLLAKGGSVDAMDSFRDYRGQDPDLRHLLTRRGLKVQA